MSEKLTVLTLCYNEEKRIRPCLESTRWADEVLVVDSCSSDASVGIARELGARVVQNGFANFSAQYNFGIGIARGDWILIVDADEIVTPDLAHSIQELLAGQTTHNVYMIRRDAIFMGRLMRSSAWSGEMLPRVFRKGFLEYSGLVHSKIEYDHGDVGRLNEGMLVHHTYRNLAQMIDKMNMYSTMGAREKFDAGKKASLFYVCVSSLWRFFHNYFIRGDIRDGVQGMVSSIFAAFSNFIKYTKLWELNREGKR